MASYYLLETAQRTCKEFGDITIGWVGSSLPLSKLRTCT